MNPSLWSRWTTIAAVLMLAVIAAVVSYSHMYELALRHGEPEWRATLFPLSVGGMTVAASRTLLSDARNGRKGGVLPWTPLIIGSAASLAANVAVADPHGLVEDHPRLCGEHGVASVGGAGRLRLTSACAESSTPAASAAGCGTTHLRLRGEHTS